MVSRMFGHPSTPKKKKPVGGNKSRKATWRRIDHSEIEDTASYDVTQNLVDRFLGNSAAGDPFFRLDAAGSAAGLSRSAKKDVIKRTKGVAEVSDYTSDAIEKTRTGLSQREATLKKEAKVRVDSNKLSHSLISGAFINNCSTRCLGR